MVSLITIRAMWMKPLLSKQDKIKSGVELLIAAGNVHVLVLRPLFFFLGVLIDIC